MKKRLLFILCLSFVAAASSAVAQTKTVTNQDLEKFRQKRVAAERDLRENYARLGFPSPEELDKQNLESRRRLSELARQLEAERIEAQKNDFLRRQTEAAEARVNYLSSPVQTGVIYQPNYLGGYVSTFGNYNFRSRARSRYFGQSANRNRYTQLNVPLPTTPMMPLIRTRPPVFIGITPRPRTGTTGNRRGGGRGN